MQQDALNGFMEQLTKGQQRAIDVARKLVDGKEHIEVTFKQPPLPPIRAESPPRRHTFWSVPGFIGYLKDYGTKNLLVLVDPNKPLVQAVLDEKAEKGFEIVSYAPLISPLWKPWNDRLGDRLEASEFRRYLVTNSEIVIDPDVSHLASVLAQIKVSKKVEMQSGCGVRSVNGLMVETRIQGQTAQMDPVELPAGLTLNCPMFVERPAVDIQIQLDVDVDDHNKVAFVLFSGDAAAKAVQQIAEIAREIKDGLPEGAHVAFGQVSHGAWDHVGPATQKGAFV